MFAISRFIRVWTLAIVVLTSAQGFFIAADAAAQSGQSGSMAVLLKGCDPGVDPRLNPEKCTDTIEDDGIEYVQDSATGTKHFLLDDNRNDEGAYVLNGLSLNTELAFNNFDPIQRDQIWSPNAFGYGTQDPWYMLYDNTRITVIFYYFDNPEAGPNTGTLVVSLRGCPAGVDPEIDPFACTEVIEDDGIEYVTTRDGAEEWYLLDDDRTMGGDYVIRGVPLDEDLVFEKFEPIKRDAAFSWNLETNVDGTSTTVVLDTYPLYVVIYYYDLP